MKNYHDLLRDILTNGTRKKNRTGIDTLMLPGAMLKFDLRDGFPAVTTKKLAFNQVKGELIGFLRGATSAAEYRALGCTVWDQNANEHGVDAHGNHVENKWLTSPFRLGHDDLGKLGYAHGWRNYGGRSPVPGFANDGIDQIAEALKTVRTDPESRRILVNAWNPAELNKAALPPCHVMFQLMPDPDPRVLHMSMYMRSADMFLGVPFNIASYALLLELFAQWTGYTAGTLTMFLSDAHIYVNHMEQVVTQISREPFPPPQLRLTARRAVESMPLTDILADLEPDDIQLVDYQSHEALRAPMAV